MVKMLFLSKLINKFKTIPIKIPIKFFAEQDKPILKFLWRCKGQKQSGHLKNNKVWELFLSDTKTNYKTIIIKTVRQKDK